jgi:hypothetical protein
MSATAESVYQLIKSYEGSFRPPASYETVNVGSFDAQTGEFHGLKTQAETDPEPIAQSPHDVPRNPPPYFSADGWVSIAIDKRWRKTVTTTPAPIVPLAPVLLKFEIVHPNPAGWSVCVNGATKIVPTTETTVSINIWDAVAANWTVTSGALSYKDRVMIQHPPGVLYPVSDAAIGAFTVPALPVTIIYAPPADSLGKSTATYTDSETIGTTITYDLNTESSQTHPVDAVFDHGAAIQTLVNEIGDGAQTAKAAGWNSPYVALVAQICKDISTELGKMGSEETRGITNISRLDMTCSQTMTDMSGTNAKVGGPGVGDIVHFYRDLRMAWVYYKGKLRLCPLGCTDTTCPVTTLQNAPSSVGLSADIAQQILSFDPFVSAGPGAALPTDRFQECVPEMIYDYGFGAMKELEQSFTRSQTRQNTTKQFTTQSDNWQPGPILKELGFGNQDKVTFTVSNATGDTVSSTVKVKLHLETGLNDHFAFRLWFDTLFGTYACQIVPTAGYAKFWGGVGGSVHPGPQQEVKLLAGNKTFSTVADKDGKFAFFTSSIPAGPASLIIGNRPAQTVQILQEAKRIVGLKTADGHFVTAVNGGGLGGPNDGPQAVALHTDATTAGPWEQFTIEWLDANEHFALKTVNGNYVTAINGGAMGGPNDATCPIHTDASDLGTWEKFALTYNRNTGTVTIQAPNGTYLTAVNGGGFGGPNNVPIHTDAVNVGLWETFTMQNVDSP